MTHRTRRRLGLLGLAIFLLLLLLWPLLARGEDVIHPGERRSLVGNRKHGWLEIRRWVEDRDGKVRRHVRFVNRTDSTFRVHWSPLDNPHGEEVDPRGLFITLDCPSPPVWKVFRLTLEVREGSKWRRVGSWWQSGPIPSKGK